MPTVFKYVKALVPINLFGGALWMEQEDIVKITETLFNSTEVQNAITAAEIVEVQQADLEPDVVSPTLKLRGDWDPSNGQLPVGRRIGDTYKVNAQGVSPYQDLVPGMRVLFTDVSVFEVLVGEGGGGGGGGATSFLQLTDVPNTYAGAGSKKVKVNSGASGLEFVADDAAGIAYTPSTPFSSTNVQGVLDEIATDFVASGGILTGMQTDIGNLQTDVTALQGNFPIAASAVTYTPTAPLSSTNVQGALDEIAGDFITAGGILTGLQTDVGNLQTDVTALQGNFPITAVAVSFDNTSTSYTSTDVQGALVELQPAAAAAKWMAFQVGNPVTVPTVTGTFGGISIGDGADSVRKAFALGPDSSATSIVPNFGSPTNEGFALAIGKGTIAVSGSAATFSLGARGATAIGDGASATSACPSGSIAGAAVAIGHNATATATGNGDSISIGSSANATDFGIAIGDNAVCGGGGVLAIGSGSINNANNALSIGGTASGGGAVSIGLGSNAVGVAIGLNAVSSNSCEVIGGYASCNAPYGVSLGGQAVVNVSGGYSTNFNIALGGFATVVAPTNLGVTNVVAVTGVQNAVAVGGWAQPHNSNETASPIAFAFGSSQYIQGQDRVVRAWANTSGTAFGPFDGIHYNMEAGGPGSGTNLIRIPDNSCAAFTGTVCAYQVGGTAGTVGDVASWKIEGVFKKIGAGAFTLVGTPTITLLGADAGAAAWDIAVGVNTFVSYSAEGLAIKVTGEADKSIHWTAVLHLNNTIAP